MVFQKQVSISKKVNSSKIFNFTEEIRKDYYDAILICVKHDSFKKLGILKIRSFGKRRHVLYDIKYLFNRTDSDLRV